MLYLDYNATFPVNPEDTTELNPASPHLGGVRAQGKFKEARAGLFELLGCLEGKIVFTSGATESINSVLSHKTLLKNKLSRAITFAGEHSVTLACANALRDAFPSTQILAIDKSSAPKLDALEETLSQKANEKAIVSVIWVNNETGVITDVLKFAEICRKYGALLHIDAAQALGKIKIDLSDIDADFVSFSGHKIGAQKGTGLLYIRDSNKFAPLMLGGGQEFGLRSGTVNLPGAISMYERLRSWDWSEVTRIQKLRDEFELGLRSLKSETRINGFGGPRVYNTSNVYFAGVSNTQLLLALSDRGIYVSTGSACSSGSMEPSHVLTAMGHGREYANSCLRFSFGPSVKSSDLDLLLKNIAELTSRFLN